MSCRTTVCSHFRSGIHGFVQIFPGILCGRLIYMLNIGHTCPWPWISSHTSRTLVDWWTSSMFFQHPVVRWLLCWLCSCWPGCSDSEPPWGGQNKLNRCRGPPAFRSLLLAPGGWSVLSSQTVSSLMAGDFFAQQTLRRNLLELSLVNQSDRLQSHASISTFDEVSARLFSPVCFLASKTPLETCRTVQQVVKKSIFLFFVVCLLSVVR